MTTISRRRLIRIADLNRRLRHNNGVAPKRPTGAEIDVKRSSGRLVNAVVIRVDQMAKQWTHSELGSFRLRTKYGDTEWVGAVDIPAFATFRYRGSRPFRGSSRVPLEFCSNDSQFIPNKKLTRLVTKIFSNQEKIATKIKTAFHDDILGLGPSSGMWWRGDKDAQQYCGEVLEARFNRKNIESPDDFDVLLGEPSITVWDGDTFARIDFGSTIEIEHGVEAITDGLNILGLGYQGDADFYLKKRG